MSYLRTAAMTAVVAVMVAALPASAAVNAASARVTGGGFIKALDKGKTTLTITGTDGEFLDDKGQAQLVRHTPGSKAKPVHITLTCVHVADSTAIASGFGSDGRMYLIVVEDNGEGQSTPDAFAVVELLGAPIFCLGGIVPTDLRVGTIQGGNFQVSDGA